MIRVAGRRHSRSKRFVDPRCTHRNRVAAVVVAGREIAGTEASRGPRPGRSPVRAAGAFSANAGESAGPGVSCATNRPGVAGTVTDVIQCWPLEVSLPGVAAAMGATSVGKQVLYICE